MTLRDLQSLIIAYQIDTARLRSKYPALTELSWQIPNLDPELILQAMHHYKAAWYRSTNCMALLIYDSEAGYSIECRSREMENAEMMGYLNMKK